MWITRVHSLPVACLPNYLHTLFIGSEMSGEKSDALNSLCVVIACFHAGLMQCFEHRARTTDYFTFEIDGPFFKIA